MTEVYEKYYNLFSTDDIGQLGIDFFNAIGHLCDKKPKYVENDPIVLVKEDLQSYVYLDAEMLADLSHIQRISFVGRVNDSVFDRQADDGFISYFAVDVNLPFRSCASYIKSIQRILMKCANKHTIALYRVENCFLLAYGYRNVGKKSQVVYSDWIVDDESAETIMDKASVWYLPFRSLSHFAFGFGYSIRRNSALKTLSYETIAYEIFPRYYEEYGFDEEKSPKRKDRQDFVEWYRSQQHEEYDEFDDDSFFLTKDGMLDDDFEVDVDELELQMLEEEMRGEGIFSSDDDYEELDRNEFDIAIRIVDSGIDFYDAEDILKELDEYTAEEPEIAQPAVVPKSRALPQIPSDQPTQDTVSGTIDEIITMAKPPLPVKLRRTTWKRPDLFFIVEEIRGQYAYGYILNNGAIERKTSYPITNEKLLWVLQVEQTRADKEIICYDGKNAKVTLLDVAFNSEDQLVRLEFKIENYGASELNIYLVNMCFDDEELEGFHSVGSVAGRNIEYATLEIADAMLSAVFLELVSTISFRIEIDDSDYEELETSESFTFLRNSQS